MAWRLVLVGACLAVLGAASELEIVQQWKTLSFDAPYNYPNRDKFRPEKTPFTSFDVGWDRIFLALPRIFGGSPATLAWIPRPKPGVPAPPDPPLRAYPSWDWHSAAAAGTVGQNGDNCTGLVSVFRMRIDRCNRLWVLDSGVLDTLETFTVACPPKILVFDLNTDRLVRSITFPSEVVRRNSLFTNLVLDDEAAGTPLGRGSCDGVFVYITDSVAPAIIVYDAAKDTTWRISHPYMFPDPDFGTYRVAGESFTLMDGVLGIAVSPPGVTPRRLFFQPFASDRLFSIATADLRRGPNPGDDGDLPVTLVGHKSSQAAGIAFNPRSGALYFAPVSETAIAAWVPGSADHRVVAFNPDLLQMCLDFRSAERDSDNIWLISTRFQRIIRDTLNPNEINFRILRVVEPPSPYALNNNSLYLYSKK